MASNLDFSEIWRLAGVGFFYFTVLMLFILLFGDNILKYVRSWLPESHGRDVQKEKLSADELVRQQEAARRRMEDDHQVKAEGFTERILKPQQEAKRADLEKEFYRNAGPAWKGKGERTRSSEEADDNPTEVRPALRRRDLEGTGRDAATARKLPESVTNPPRPPPADPPKTKIVITLPEEPELGTPKNITVALRGTLGQVKRRRFLYTDKVQVLLDWMSKLGYHPKLYTLLTTYPRRDLSQNAAVTLEEAGIDHDVALVVEEIIMDGES